MNAPATPPSPIPLKKRSPRKTLLMLRPMTSEKATEVAMQNTLLTPRFYTTDFEEMDAIDVTPVREEWDILIDQMKSDPNKGHFKKR